MTKPIWFPFYPADFLTSNRVALMTTEEIGGYTLLLCYAWQDPTCTLPADDEAIRKLSRLTGSLEAVKSCFIQKRGRLINERLYKEWQKFKEKSELAKRSNAVRWENERKANAKRTQSSSHRNIGTEEQKNRRTSEHPNIRTEEELEKEIKSSAGPSAPALLTPAQKVWNRYKDAYMLRYKTDPIRNAAVNGQIAQLIKRLGGEVAPEVAAFYVWHNDVFYVRNQHPIRLLLQACEGLHTQWANGQSITQSQARKIDETAGRVNVFQELINEQKGQVIDVKTS